MIIFAAAAVIFIPLFRKLGLGAILAYLFAGLFLGPDGLKLIQDPKTILHFSELGVVFLLFIIGLELAPKRLWRMRTQIFGMGGLQVLLTGLAFMAIALAFGFSPGAAFAAGFGLALSSTAFAIPMLEEKNLLSSPFGQGAFAILMFQDLAVVPILSSLKIFTDSGIQFNGMELLINGAAILVLILLGPTFVRPALRLVADSKAPEVFTALALFIVLGTALLVEHLGLSMGTGAFLAGVLLANSEYRHELEVNLQPFKGLLLGLFFMAVGMSLDLEVLKTQLHWILITTAALISLKAFLIYILSRGFRFSRIQARGISSSLSQGGEFAFVLFSAALALKIMTTAQTSFLSAVVILSMALTPLVFWLNQRFAVSRDDDQKQKYDEIPDEQTDVIIAGFGRFGQIVSRMLRAEKVSVTILEHNASQVDTARKFGNKVYYGDASRKDILHAAGAEKAQIFVLAIDDMEASIKTAKMVKEQFPHLSIVARVRNRQHAIGLMELGVDNIHRETYLTSLEVAKEVLLKKGHDRQNINKRLAFFRSHDERILRDQYDHRNDEKKFVSFTNQATRDLEQILEEDRVERKNAALQNSEGAADKPL